VGVTHSNQLIARARHVGCDVIQEYVNKGQKDQRNAGDAEKIPGKRFKAASTRRARAIPTRNTHTNYSLRVTDDQGGAEHRPYMPPARLPVGQPKTGPITK